MRPASPFGRFTKFLPGATLSGVLVANPQMGSVLRMVEKITSTDVGVVLFGERGRGKNMLARAIHGLSPRAGGPFVAVNCATIRGMFLEGELSGRADCAPKESGGKIGSVADSMIFLNEVGELPLPMQAKLLSLLQKRNLDRLMSVGRFCEDLYYRLNEVRLVVRPLREHEDDRSYSPIVSPGAPTRSLAAT